MSTAHEAPPSGSATPRVPTGRPLFVASVVILALAVAISWGLPPWQQSRRSAQVRATLADLQVFEAAFRAYAHDHGDWPMAAAPGRPPAGMDAVLNGTAWAKPSPIGGHYAWLVQTRQSGQRLAAVIGIVSTPNQPVSSDPRVLTELIEQARTRKDPSGQLRLGFRHEPILVLEN